MNKKGSIKNVIIVILCITIIAMGIGFMVLSMRLEKYRSEEEIFDVRFTSTKLMSSIKGGEKDPKSKLKIDKDGKILKMDFRLFHEHDQIDYEVIVKNRGTVPASIVSLFSSPDFRSKETIQNLSPITISISDISGKLLEPGEETTVKISAIYNKDATNTKNKDVEKKVTGKLGIISESKN